MQRRPDPGHGADDENAARPALLARREPETDRDPDGSAGPPRRDGVADREPRGGACDREADDRDADRAVLLAAPPRRDGVADRESRGGAHDREAQYRESDGDADSDRVAPSNNRHDGRDDRVGNHFHVRDLGPPVVFLSREFRRQYFLHVWLQV